MSAVAGSHNRRGSEVNEETPLDQEGDFVLVSTDEASNHVEIAFTGQVPNFSDFEGWTDGNSIVIDGCVRDQLLHSDSPKMHIKSILADLTNLMGLSCRQVGQSVCETLSSSHSVGVSHELILHMIDYRSGKTRSQTLPLSRGNIAYYELIYLVGQALMGIDEATTQSAVMRLEGHGNGKYITSNPFVSMVVNAFIRQLNPSEELKCPEFTFDSRINMVLPNIQEEYSKISTFLPNPDNVFLPASDDSTDQFHFSRLIEDELSKFHVAYYLLYFSHAEYMPDMAIILTKDNGEYRAIYPHGLSFEAKMQVGDLQFHEDITQRVFHNPQELMEDLRGQAGDKIKFRKFHRVHSDDKGWTDTITEIWEWFTWLLSLPMDAIMWLLSSDDKGERVSYDDYAASVRALPEASRTPIQTQAMETLYNLSAPSKPLEERELSSLESVVIPGMGCFLSSPLDKGFQVDLLQRGDFDAGLLKDALTASVGILGEDGIKGLLATINHMRPMGLQIGVAYELVRLEYKERSLGIQQQCRMITRDEYGADPYMMQATEFEILHVLIRLLETTQNIARKEVTNIVYDEWLIYWRYTGLADSMKKNIEKNPSNPFTELEKNRINTIPDVLRGLRARQKQLLGGVSIPTNNLSWHSVVETITSTKQCGMYLLHVTDTHTYDRGLVKSIVEEKSSDSSQTLPRARRERVILIHKYKQKFEIDAGKRGRTWSMPNKKKEPQSQLQTRYAVYDHSQWGVISEPGEIRSYGSAEEIPQPTYNAANLVRVIQETYPQSRPTDLIFVREPDELPN